MTTFAHRRAGLIPLGTSRRGVLVAVCTLRQPTIRDVASVAGVTVAEAHRHLCWLRGLGLVTWERGRAGTLRPLVTVEPADGPR